MDIFRKYDIRGRYGSDITDEKAYKIARILVDMYGAKEAVIGYDISPESPKIYQSLINGLRDQGCNVTQLGLAGTDIVYFAGGQFGFDLSLEVTASHTAGYLHGIKILTPGAEPFGWGFGMEGLKTRFQNYEEKEPTLRGNLKKKNVFPDFIKKSLSFVDYGRIKPLKVAVDSSNSVASLEIDVLEEFLPQVEFIRINWELDGSYPAHDPNPFLEENRKQLSRKIKKVKADFGVAFDGDADRIYFLNGKGDYLFGVYINGLIARKMCLEEPQRAVIHDIRAVNHIKDKIEESGGIPKLELVGHTFFKKRMKEENALFGAESSGHMYYNFGNYMVENSIIALLQIMEIISQSGKSLTELTREARRNYPVSGEYNFSLPNFGITPQAEGKIEDILDQVRKKYSDGCLSDFDTLTVKYPNWRFNLRPSANEPVLRYNGEAKNSKLLIKKQKKLFKFLKSLGCKYLNDSGVKLL